MILLGSLIPPIRFAFLRFVCLLFAASSFWKPFGHSHLQPQPLHCTLSLPVPHNNYRGPQATFAFCHFVFHEPHHLCLLGLAGTRGEESSPSKQQVCRCPVCLLILQPHNCVTMTLTLLPCSHHPAFQSRSPPDVTFYISG